MKIKGSGNKYYEVDLSDLTCSCKDWSCRRHNFVKGDDRRLCKHLLEAIEMSSYIRPFKIKDLENPVIISDEDKNWLSNVLSSSCIILKYSICKSNNNVLKSYLPIVVELTYDDINEEEVDNIIKYKYSINFIGYNKSIRYYNGPIPIVVILSRKEFLFKSLFYSMSEDEFMKLSSYSYNKIGLRISANGFLDNDNNIIDKNINTYEELFDFLGINNLENY